MLNVLLADGHQNMRKVISEILRDADVRLIAEASSFGEIMRLLARVRPDVVLMDVHMSDERYVKPSDLRSCLADCQLLAMSLWTDPETKALAEYFGAVALLDKTSLADELLPSLRQCAQRYGQKVALLT
jgi:DNA-binding NarL/FixJ family response regulator